MPQRNWPPSRKLPPKAAMTARSVDSHRRFAPSRNLARPSSVIMSRCHGGEGSAIQVTFVRASARSMVSDGEHTSARGQWHWEMCAAPAGILPKIVPSVEVVTQPPAPSGLGAK